MISSEPIVRSLTLGSHVQITDTDFVIDPRVTCAGIKVITQRVAIRRPWVTAMAIVRLFSQTRMVCCDTFLNLVDDEERETSPERWITVYQDRLSRGAKVCR